MYVLLWIAEKMHLPVVVVVVVVWHTTDSSFLLEGVTPKNGPLRSSHWPYSYVQPPQLGSF